MTANFIALGLIAAVSFLVPPIILLIVFMKNPIQRKGILLSFMIGGGIGVIFEWLIKEQGLTWLFNHTDLQSFSNSHFITYLFLVALAGALLAVVPECLVVVYGYKRQMSFAKAAMMGLGFAMAEAVTLAGYRSIATLVEMVKQTDTELYTGTGELFLSFFERCLMMVIHVGIVVSLVYFIENKIYVRGCLIALLCLLLESFVPGFLIAFSTPAYLELYTRSTALILVYVILFVMAVCCVMIMNMLRYSLQDGNVYSKQAIAAYQDRHKNSGESKNNAAAVTAKGSGKKGKKV